MESLVTAARAGRRPRVVSVQTPKRAGQADAVLQLSVDLDEINDGGAPTTLDLRVADHAVAASDGNGSLDAIPLMLVGTHLLADGLLELRSSDYRLVLRVDTAAIEQLLTTADPLTAPIDASSLAEMLLDSQIVEAEPIAPEGFVRHGATGLFLPSHVRVPDDQLDMVDLRDISAIGEGGVDVQALEPAVALQRVDAKDRGSFVRAGSATVSSWPTVCFWLAVVGVALFRYGVLATAGAPATIDTGNWLAFAESLFGQGSRPSSVVYPPLVPVLVQVAVSLFGVVRGVAVMGALASLAPALGVYKALGMAGLGRERVVPALLLLGAGSVGEAAAWGGFPQLIALGLLPIAVVLAIEAFEQPEWTSSLRLGLVVMVSLATSHFVSVLMLLAVGLVALAAFVRHRGTGWSRDLIHVLPWLIGPSVWLIPTYVRLIDAVILHPNEFAALDNLTLGDSLGRLDNIYSEFPALWQVLVPLAALTPMLTWPARRTLPWRLSTAATVATCLLLAATQEARYLYLVPVLVALALGVWALQLASFWASEAATGQDRLRYAVIGVAAVLVCLQLQAGMSGFERQREFYRVLSPGLVEAIDVADEVADEDDVIAVPSLDDAPIGWWVEGMTDAQVFYGSPLRWLNFADEVARARIANEVFDPSFPSEATLPLLEAVSVDVMIVPRTWAWFDDDALDAWIAEHELEVLVRNRNAVAIALG